MCPDTIVPLCQYCKKRPVEPPRRKFCSPRCSNLSYQSRRYKADGDFQVKHRNCWKVYVTECQICGKPLREAAKCDHDMRVVVGDAESMFATAEGRMRMIAIMAASNNRGISGEEMFGMLRRDASATGIKDDVLRKIIEEVLL